MMRMAAAIGIGMGNRHSHRNRIITLTPDVFEAAKPDRRYRLGCGDE